MNPPKYAVFKLQQLHTDSHLKEWVQVSRWYATQQQAADVYKRYGGPRTSTVRIRSDRDID